MGREVRRVPVDWQHPTYGDLIDRGDLSEWVLRSSYRTIPRTDPFPTYDKSYAAACSDWKQAFADWESDKNGERTKIETKYGRRYEYWDWNGMPPNQTYYRAREWAVEEATAYQLYETVSEGTPVSPVFATAIELETWLIREKGMTLDGAHYLVEEGWIPSGMVNTAKGVNAWGLDVAEVAASDTADTAREGR